MGDIFVEQLVKRQTQSGQKGIIFVLSLLAAVLCFAGFFLYNIILLPAAAVVGIAVWYYRSTDIEYEYCLVNSQFDVDKIIAKSKRKQLISVDLKNLEVAAPVGSDRLIRLNNLKTLDFTTGEKNVQTFAMAVRTDKESIKIIFNPNNKLMDAIYKMAPGKVFAD